MIDCLGYLLYCVVYAWCVAYGRVIKGKESKL